MNAILIRQNLRIKRLYNYYSNEESLVIEELGLNHGKSRADIAVLNGRFVGYEIKSNNDSLRRLKEQIKSYNAVFDKVYTVVGNRHSHIIHKYLPSWWGIIKVLDKNNSDIDFQVIREAGINEDVDPVSVAKLLWRDEALEVLRQKRISPKILQQPRAVLYKQLANTLSIAEIRKVVREHLKQRKNWRCPESPFQYDELCQPAST